MKETKKATLRRLNDIGFPWRDVFAGNVLDVGAGDDPLEWPGATVIPFDKEQGDANAIAQFFAPNYLDCVHGSQVMEHLHNPQDFLRQCLSIVKPGGWVVMTIPDFDLYEGGIFPSRYNGDHKTTWSLWRKTPPTKFPHVFVPDLRTVLIPHQFDCRLVNTNYDWFAQDKDQTFIHENLVEAFIEILIRKAPNV